MAEPPIGAKLRTALEDKGWSYRRLIAEMRKVAGRQGKALPATASLIAMLSRWLNGHERPGLFYRKILSLGAEPVRRLPERGLVEQPAKGLGHRVGGDLVRLESKCGAGGQQGRGVGRLVGALWQAQLWQAIAERAPSMVPAPAWDTTARQWGSTAAWGRNGAVRTAGVRGPSSVGSKPGPVVTTRLTGKRTHPSIAARNTLGVWFMIVPRVR